MNRTGQALFPAGENEVKTEEGLTNESLGEQISKGENAGKPPRRKNHLPEDNVPNDQNAKKSRVNYKKSENTKTKPNEIGRHQTLKKEPVLAKAQYNAGSPSGEGEKPASQPALSGALEQKSDGALSLDKDDISLMPTDISAHREQNLKDPSISVPDVISVRVDQQINVSQASKDNHQIVTQSIPDIVPIPFKTFSVTDTAPESVISRPQIEKKKLFSRKPKSTLHLSELRKRRRRRSVLFEEMLGWILVPLILIGLYWLFHTLLTASGLSLEGLMNLLKGRV
jgi:hypothetical protein